MPPWVAALIVLLVLAVGALLEPSHAPSNYAAQAPAYDDTAKDHFWEAFSAIGAVFAAVFTGVLAVFAFIQVRDSRRSSERQLRAYVFPKTIALHGCGVGEKPRLDLEIRNTGQTPAYRLKQACRGGYQDYPLIGELPETKDAEKETIPLGPDAFMYATPSAPTLSAARIADIAAGKKAVYFVGQIDYVDAFSHERWVKYCFYTGGDLPLVPLPSTKGTIPAATMNLLVDARAVSAPPQTIPIVSNAINAAQ